MRFRNKFSALVTYSLFAGCSLMFIGLQEAQAGTQTKTERKDSFGDSVRPISIGNLNFKTKKILKGTLHTLDRDSSDGFSFTMKRPGFVTIKPSRKLELTLTQGTRVVARNFPVFRAIRIKLERGSYKLSARPLGHKKTKYSIEFSARR